LTDVSAGTFWNLNGHDELRYDPVMAVPAGPETHLVA
jgi:hypothetical protein